MQNSLGRAHGTSQFWCAACEYATWQCEQVGEQAVTSGSKFPECYFTGCRSVRWRCVKYFCLITLEAVRRFVLPSSAYSR
jgi:hypothetical protein